LWLPLLPLHRIWMMIPLALFVCMGPFVPNASFIVSSGYWLVEVPCRDRERRVVVLVVLLPCRAIVLEALF
jgi:hypothetical protein